MRRPSTFSETRLRSSFFLTTPAKKPRTECCCQSVAFMIAAIVVPFGSYSILSTADCLDGPQARRLLALAAIYEGATRTDAAKIGGVTLQIVRDWVVKFNAL